MDALAALEALKSLSLRVPFYFVRHGETDWNKNRLAQGQTDIPLNQAGRDQAHQAAPLLAGHGMTRVITSPLSRAQETADIINRTLSLPMEQHAGLMERYFGPLEGKPWAPGFVESEPGGDAEPRPQFINRVMSTLVELLERPGPLLLVSHGGVYKALVELLCALPEARASNAVPFRFDPPSGDDTRWTLQPVDPIKTTQ